MKKILSIFAVTALVLTVFSVVKAEELEFGGSNLAETEEVQFGGSNLEETQSTETEEINFGGSDLGGNTSEESSDEELEFGGSDLGGSTPVVEEPTNNTGSSNKGGSSSGSRGRGGNGGRTNLPSTPSVLGAAVGPNGETLACAPHFTTFMRIGQVNNVEEVKKLQTYLNTFGGAKLPVTGFFGSMTDAAVKVWQTKNADAILKPWGANVGATGYFFKMSQWFANKQMCPTLNAPTPILN